MRRHQEMEHLQETLFVVQRRRRGQKLDAFYTGGSGRDFVKESRIPRCSVTGQVVRFIDDQHLSPPQERLDRVAIAERNDVQRGAKAVTEEEFQGEFGPPLRNQRTGSNHQDLHVIAAVEEALAYENTGLDGLPKADLIREKIPLHGILKPDRARWRRGRA